MTPFSTSVALTLGVLVFSARAHAEQAPVSAAPVEATAAATASPVQGARRAVSAMRLAEGDRVRLDGQLDEAFWNRASPASRFVQQDPDNGDPATEQTEVRIVYSNQAIYLGVRCFDSEPDRWLGYQRRRDETLGSDDRFQWTIDTFLDGRSGYFFEMNPSGLMADALLGNGQTNRQWDGIWDAVVRHDDLGWTLEIEIPFQTLSFDPAADAWGINFQRTVRRKNEESLWSGWGRNQGLQRLTSAGLLTGIRDISQGRGLDLKPYLLGTSSSSPSTGDGRHREDVDVGLDAFYSPSPGIRAVMTVNTDFAQTEVDQRQVNLSRFSIMFPERRDFFLDGSTFFDFRSQPTSRRGGGGQESGQAQGTSGRSLNPFFSRRIGLSEENTPQKIDFGGKVTGQLGQEDFGFLHVRTGTDDTFTGEDFTVARVRHRLLAQSFVGGLYTRRAGAGHVDLHTIGVDASFATSSFRGSSNLEASGYYLRATNPDGTGKQSSYGGFVDYPNDRIRGRVVFREVQPNFDPAVGFVSRAGYRLVSPFLSFTPRPARHPWIRRFEFAVNAPWLLDLDGRGTLTRDIELTVFKVETHSQDSVTVVVTPFYERLDDTFTVGGVELPEGGRYSWTRYTVQATTANRRKVALSPTVEWGDFYTGRRFRTALDLTLRLRPGLIFYLFGESNRVDIEGHRTYTRLYRTIAEAQFSPRMALVNNLQYDTQSSTLGWQSRFRWILKPGNDLYLVYTHNWRDDPLLNRFSTTDRRMASKLLYTHRF